MGLSIDKKRDGDKLEVSLDGRLDTNMAPELTEVFKQELYGVKELVLDFAKLEYVSSAGLRVILAGSKTMLGALADVTLERTDDGVRIASHGIVPLVTHADASYGSFTAYLLDEYTDSMAAQNKIFRVVEKSQGVSVDCAYLSKLFNDILHRRAQAYNKYKTPWDVNVGNLKGVLNALRGKNVKG